jgi:hypothetical protein
VPQSQLLQVKINKEELQVQIANAREQVDMNHEAQDEKKVKQYQSR